MFIALYSIHKVISSWMERVLPYMNHKCSPIEQKTIFLKDWLYWISAVCFFSYNSYEHDNIVFQILLEKLLDLVFCDESRLELFIEQIRSLLERIGSMPDKLQPFE